MYFTFPLSKDDCKLQINNKCVGLAFRQDKPYLLSMSENVNFECNKAENAMTANASKKTKRELIPHRNYGTVAWGRIKRLDKESILPPLELFELEQCIDCIKGKLVKNIKKGAKC